ncbi:outer membrane protein assembly factor BamA [Novosphingobium sp.]|uniref:outer membrane protein assembly factor BamA n=1 Tax=Novosphingobium sp. TaxID=1874826 RepID=UPI0025D7C25B|nr:outer membrane protein assembly factor BamA [Novosphingobium sp.]MCC6926375.1 outer membrane protein assembly factor BamA [Novosphingobium sp.]
MNSSLSDHSQNAPAGLRLAIALLGSSVLAGVPQTALAQAGAQPAPVAPVAAPAPAADVIQSITVNGAQRLEPDTIRSYIKMRIGQPYSQAAADQVLKDLFATELFSDVKVSNNAGAVVIEVKENPVINRIILEGNKRIKNDKILPEIKLAPRQIFTRSKVRADVSRIIELYKRQGRFAASVEPKMVLLDQNRIDIVFEINEGPKSKVRMINVIGNEAFSDNELKGEMFTKEARFSRLFSSGTTYDPDRMAFDQQKLRQFYLTKGYADFRVVSAVAELTPDKKDFILTYVVEEGPRYKFGDVKVESQLRDFDGERLASQLPMKKGDWYNAKLVEDTIERLNETLGAFGYAFADVRPDYARNKDELTMGLTFEIAEAPRVYVERIDVNGNTLTQDKVVRREFRLAEGDAFNSLQVKRSTARINSLGYFQEKFEVEQKGGSAPDRIVLEANVEEKPTGQLQLSAGYSSLEKLIFQGSVEQRNFRGRGQTIGLNLAYSQYSKQIDVSFTEPYLFDRNVSTAVNIYRRDLNSFNYLNSNRNTIYKQTTTGLQIRAGVPLTEYVSFVGSYTLNFDDVTVDPSLYYSTRQNPPLSECDPLIAGRYLCDALGKRTSSILGMTLIYDSLDNRMRPSRGRSASITGEFAGLGGSVKYARVRGNAAQYFPVGGGFIFSVKAEGGAIFPLNDLGNAANGVDDVRLTDRFYLGEPQMRGFDIRGLGPRVIRKPFDTVNNVFIEDRDQWSDDAIGGHYYYLAHAELEIPLGSGAKEMGLRPSIFLDAGAVWGITSPNPLPLTFPYTQVCNGVTTTGYATSQAGVPTLPATCTGTGDTVVGGTPFREFFLGNSAKPRVAVGIGVNWNSPFGPFRIDFAKTLLKVDGDDTKSFTFNVGTQF